MNTKFYSQKNMGKNTKQINTFSPLVFLQPIDQQYDKLEINRRVSTDKYDIGEFIDYSSDEELEYDTKFEDNFFTKKNSSNSENNNQTMQSTGASFFSITNFLKTPTNNNKTFIFPSIFTHSQPKKISNVLVDGWQNKIEFVKYKTYIKLQLLSKIRKNVNNTINNSFCVGK